MPKTLKRCGLAMLFAPLFLARCAHAQDIARKADQFVQTFVDQKSFQGSVLVARKGERLFRKSYGLANAEWNVPNTPDTRFRIGSITKQFTAALILQLVDQGKLSLDDSIRKYYTDAPNSWQPVTIHDLLSHQSGIPNYTDLAGFPQMAAFPRSPAQIIQLIADKPLEFDAGTKFKYDNTGYVLLGYIIEKLTGRSYEEQLRRSILEPLGMQNTGFDSHNLLPYRAEGYQYVDGRLRRAPYSDSTEWFAAGGLYSTVGDLGKWDQALYGTSVLSEASKEKMWTPYCNEYGYGWDLVERYGLRAQEHSGSIPGFDSMIVRLPEKGIFVVVLGNLSTLRKGAIAEGLVALALGERAPNGHLKTAVKPEEAGVFAGRYASPDLAMTIQRENDHVVVHGNGQGPLFPFYPLGQAGWPFYAFGEGQFFNDQLGVELDFDRDGSALTVYQGGYAQRIIRQ